MNDYLVSRNCPTCHSPANKPAIVPSVNPESLNFETLKKHWSGFFKGSVFFPYHRCKSCATLFAPTYFAPTRIAELYSSMSDNTAGLPIDLMKKTQQGYYKELKDIDIPEGDFGEVGPDIGLFTAYCLSGERKFNKYILWEPNVAVHSTLKNLLSSDPHHISTDMENLEGAEDNSLSLLAMIHVLDHLIDPEIFIKKAVKKLKAGGVLLIVTHDESSLLAKITGKRWPAYCLQHPQLYSRESMFNFLSANGANPIKFAKTKNYFPLTYMIKHLLFTVGIRREIIPQNNKLALPLKLGNMLTIAVRSE